MLLIGGSGSGASSLVETTGRSGVIDAASNTSNTFSNTEIYIPNYTSNNYKSVSTDSVMENNATEAYANLNAILWSNTSAINSITLTPSAGNFAQYSEFTLYGVYAGGTTTPSAPTIASATDLGGGTAQVTISSPAAIPYTVTSSPSGITATGMSPINISGLSPQTAYTFTAQAVAPFGVSSASSASSSVSMYNGMTALATVAVGSGGSSTITFSSIPSGYSHLQIRSVAEASTTAAYVMRFNSDSSNTYWNHELFGDGSSTASTARVPRTYIINQAAGISTTANIFTASIVDILDYSNTNKYKTVRLLSGQDYNGSGSIYLQSGAWPSTSAITQIDILPSSGSFNQYSTFVLYGVK
jgi:hypothetical protein